MDQLSVVKIVASFARTLPSFLVQSLGILNANLSLSLIAWWVALKENISQHINYVGLAAACS